MTAPVNRRVTLLLAAGLMAASTAACATQSAGPDSLFVTAPQTLAAVQRGNEPQLSLGATLVFAGERQAQQFTSLKVRDLFLIADEEPGAPESRSTGWSTDRQKYLKVFLSADARCGDTKGMSQAFPGTPCSFTVLKVVTEDGAIRLVPIGRITVPPHEINSGGKAP